jgi:hypothetical protein
MKVNYKDVVYTVLDEKDGRVYMEDEEGNEKDIAESTFEKAEEIKEEPVKRLTKKERRKKAEARLKERIPFKALYDGEKYVDDITVTVNGTNYVIRRGITVMIPRFVYNVLSEQERQKAVAASTSQKFHEQYKNKEKQFI